MRFIHQRHHAMRMRQFYNGTQVRADTVIGRVIYKYCRCVRMLQDRLFHLGQLHTERDTDMIIHLRIDIHRLRPAQYQRIDHAAVHITRQDDLISRLAGREHHALYRRGGPAYHKVRMIRPKRICCQLFRLIDHRDRMAEIVQRFHGIDIQTNTLFPQKRHQFRVAASALVPRHIKRNDTLLTEAFQCLI